MNKNILQLWAFFKVTNLYIHCISEVFTHHSNITHIVMQIFILFSLRHHNFISLLFFNNILIFVSLHFIFLLCRLLNLFLIFICSKILMQIYFNYKSNIFHFGQDYCSEFTIVNCQVFQFYVPNISQFLICFQWMTFILFHSVLNSFNFLFLIFLNYLILYQLHLF